MGVKGLFSKEEQQAIVEAIKEAELNTSGEIRVHIESHCKIDSCDRAAYIFNYLGMCKTKERNGVLFYLAVKSRKFAVIGDSGIDAKVPDGFWDSVKASLASDFAKGDFAGGLIRGIRMAGESLKKYFPYSSDDVNEQPDEISFGK